jgi:DNA processing protein
MDETRACATLARTPALTAEHVFALAAGSRSCAEAVSRVPLDPATSLPPAARAFLSSPDSADIDEDLRWLSSSGARLIACVSPEYPALLATIPDAPPVLYVLGDVEALSTPQLAMVGSRNPTAGGRAIAGEFAAFFAKSGLVITSGLALGIDAACHEGALAADGLTIAVCGCGLDQTYPPRHGGLAARIRERGALVSEFPPRTPPLRSLFPQRNRIISGLSLGTLVVEAGEKSGALITVRFALEQGRDVFAVPGPIFSPKSAGPNQLIRDGAGLVARGQDILEALNLSTAVIQQEVQAALPDDPTEAAVMGLVSYEAQHVDEIRRQSDMPITVVSSTLAILELKGLVRQAGPMQYVLAREERAEYSAAPAPAHAAP